MQAGGFNLTLSPDTTVFVDRVDEQVRVMILRGKAKIKDGYREFPISTSLQAVLSPEPNPGYFIDDGVYRRPFIQLFEDKGRKTLVRQFYLEQVVYTDPILRHLFVQGGNTRRLVETLNKAEAIFGDLNGTANYAPDQV